jgi:CPA2 family monovalent cation:H+ antiporter-2
MLATLFIIVIGKSLAAFVIVRAFGHPTTTALTISASLAQIGEFSFILAELGVKLNLMPHEGLGLILAGAILSIMLNPLIFAAVDRLNERAEARVKPAGGTEDAVVAEAKVTALTDHAILIGYGRVGRRIGVALTAAGRPFLVIEASDDLLAELKQARIEAIAGNAAQADVLAAANLKAARNVIIAIPEAFEAGQIIEQARAANPKVQIVARAHRDAEVDHLINLGADVVVMGEREIARGIIDHVLAPAGDADAPASPLPA